MTTGEGASAGAHLLVGCGYTGARLARRLRLRGAVRGLVRSEASAAALAAAGISTGILDLDQPGPCDPPGSLASVVYLAPPPSAGEDDPRLRRLLAALGEARPRAMVYLSTTGVYGDTAGRPVDEASPARPQDAASRRRLAAEGAAAAWCAVRGVRCVILRVAGIYGPHRLPLDRLRAGEPVLQPEDAGPGNRIFVDDLVAACEAALERPVAGVINVADGCADSLGAFFERVAWLAGLPAPRRVTLAEARRALSPGLLAYATTHRQVRNRRMVEELGICPVDPDAGIRSSLEEMGLSSEGR